MNQKPGLGTGKLTLVVSAIHILTPRIRAYELRAPNGGELPLVTAGSHLAIPVVLGDGRTDVRQYSICSNPGQRDFYRIAVLRENAAHSGSIFIHDNFSVGMQLHCALPKNNFHLHADASPAVFIAGGIGITPIIAMAHTLATRGRRFSLHYAGRSKSEMAFVEELQQDFNRQVQLYPADEKIRMDVMHVLADAPGNAHFYVCGPQRLLDETMSAASALGIAKDRIQREHFHAEKFAGDKPVVLELARSNKVINAGADQSLLAALRDAGVHVNFDCCVGDCGTCAVKVLEGEPEHRDHVLSDAAKAKGRMCVCVSRARGEKLVLDL
jgi:ferredoxin-NADP reductase